MKTGKRNIKNGDQFNHLFPIPKGENQVIKKVAELDDTIKLMKQVTAATLEDTLALAQMLKASTEKQTCTNIWNFCFNHLQYTKDELGKEQVRRPSRVWQDRKRGVDCDCMSVFIGSILTNLGIPISFRLTKYQSPEYEHVYPIAHTENGILIMDTVVHEFNREVPYSAKKDIKMELQYLNGFEEEDFDQFDDLDEIIDNEYPMDAQGLVGDEDLEGLEGRAERLSRRAERKEKRQERRENRPPIKERISKGLHTINRINPATALLRAGVLASMKLNLMNVASKLRFAYWSDAEAQKNHMDMGKFAQLKRIREKLEKIFFGAGGKPQNLKKAILSGKGNRDRRVVLNGLGEIISAVYDEDSLQTILGDDLYYDELADQGVNGLGAIATGAAITAASGVIGTISVIIKKLGGLFKKGTPQAEQEIVQDNTSAQEEKTRKFSLKNLVSRIGNRNNQTPAVRSSIAPTSSQADTSMDDYSEDELMTRGMDTTSDNPDEKPEKKGIIGWVKENPLLTAGIATAVVGGTILVVRASKKKKGLAGVPKTKRSKKSVKSSTAKKRTSTSSTKRKPTTRRRKPATRRASTVKKIELL
jgi:hypothetical protein